VGISELAAWAGPGRRHWVASVLGGVSWRRVVVRGGARKGGQRSASDRVRGGAGGKWLFSPL